MQTSVENNEIWIFFTFHLWNYVNFLRGLLFFLFCLHSKDETFCVFSAFFFNLSYRKMKNSIVLLFCIIEKKILKFLILLFPPTMRKSMRESEKIEIKEIVLWFSQPHTPLCALSGCHIITTQFSNETRKSAKHEWN